jgi:gliding motility-associated-like protein
MHKYASRILVTLVAFFLAGSLRSQGNKLSIVGSAPKNMTICGLTDTARVTVLNISSSTISSVIVTLSMPTGMRYVPGSVSGTGVSESNITNLNRPVFSAPTLGIGKNFTFRYRVRANCDMIPVVSGPSNPSISIRVDYSGNFDAALSLPFTSAIPSLGYGTITNQTFTGNVGDKFVRRVTFTNFGKGPLLYLRLVRVKGKDLTLRSEGGFSHRYNGDSVITTLNKTDIQKVGNKDTFLDQNESISISDTFTIIGCTFLSTSYDLAWGCDGKFCQVVKNTATTAISTASPNLQVVISSSIQPVYNNTTVSKFTMRIANIGQMTAIASDALIFQTVNPGGGFYNYVLSRIDSTSIRLKKGWNGSANRAYTDTFLSNAATPCWSAGSMGGFRLRLGNMQPKDTVYITWDVYRCANTNCNTGFYELGWGYRSTYRNQCNTVLSTGNQWTVGYTYSGGAVTPYTPTDLQQNEVKPFRYTFSGMGNLPLHSSAAIRIDLVLPNTLTHNLTKADFYIDNPNLTAIWYPDSLKMVKDTLRAFMGRSVVFGLTNSELTVRLKGACPTGSNNNNLPLTLIYAYNPNTSAHPNLWVKPICNTVNVKVHCRNVCTRGGMLFRNFELYRSNYGRPDNDNNGLPDATGSIDKLKIRTERIMFGDTLTTIFRGRPRNASGINNWRYGYAESVVTNGDYISVVDAKLEVHKGITKVSGNCGTVRWKKVSSGVNATFYFDFTVDSIWRGGCLSSTYRFTQNDSVSLIVRYKVDKNRGQITQPMNFSNRFYLATAANPTLSQSYQCDTFSGNCVLYGYIFHNWGSDNISYASCNEVAIAQNFYLGIGNCCNYGGGNIFPFEYRNWGRPVAMKLTMPSGLKLGRTSFIQYRTAGTNNTVTERKDTVPFRRGSSYWFDFAKYYKDSGGPVNYSDDGFHGTFWYTVYPTCDLIPNVAYPIQYDYVYEKRGALGKGYDTVRSQIMRTPDFFTFVPPKFTLQPALPIVYGTKDTVEWEVRYTNPSTTFTANAIWLSPAKNSNIRVVQIRDWVRDTIIKPVNDIYRAGSLPAGQTRRFKVRAVFSNCTPDSLLLYGGWNCQTYPNDFTSNTCATVATKLYLEPLNTRLNLTLTDSLSKFDLCYPNRMTLVIDNVQSVNAHQLKARITLPIGMDMISGNNFIRYPHKSAAVKLSNPTLLTGTTWEWDLAKLVSGLSAGFPGTADTNKNKIIITFRVKTNCDYASGSFISARASSNIRCGDPVPANTSYTNPLEIKGVVKTMYTQVKNWTDSILPCEKPAISKIRVIVLGPRETDSNDRVEVILPPGISRDATYFKAIRNAPNKDSVQVSNFNGATLLSWPAPRKLQPGDSLEFDIRLLSNGAQLNCGTADILSRTVASQKVECVPENKICNIKIVTGSVLTAPAVDKGNLQFTGISISATRLLKSDTEQVTLKYGIKNLGKYTSSATTIVVRYHYDNDGNGKWSAGDARLATDTLRRNLKKDSVFWVTRTLRIKAGQSCAMLAVIDSGACACKFGQTAFPAAYFPNAGRDTSVCSGSPWKLGTLSSIWYKYSWDRTDLLDSFNIGNPVYYPENSGSIPDTQYFMLSTNRGVCSSKDTVRLIVQPLPTLVFSNKSINICEGASASLSNSVNGGFSPYKWRWTPATGLSDTTASVPVAKPKTDTRYTLRITDKLGCMKTDTVRVTVNPNPVARFFWPVTCAGRPVVVSDSSSILRDTIVSRLWSATGFDTFGLKVLNFNMNGRSRVPLTLMVYSNKGCGDTLTRTVDVKAIPKVAFQIPYVCNGDSSRFANQTTLDSGFITAWGWDFGDGKTATVKNPVHRYADTGIRTVMLAAQSNNGCADTIRKTARVFPLPSAAFTFNNVCSGDSFAFADVSKLFGDTLKSRTWNLGVMGSATDSSLKRLVNPWGKYPVTLSIETIHGCKNAAKDTSRVYPLPLPAFTADSVCEGLTTRFINTTKIPQGNIAAYNWQFGDGNNSTVVTPSNAYAMQGLYTVGLKATSDKGCVDSVKNTITVFAPAWPVFSVNNLCLRQRLISSASHRGAGTPFQYRWYLGNGDSISTLGLNYTYSNFGTYSVRVRIITDKGCIRDSSASVTVHPLPQVAFTAVNPCKDDSLVFTAQTGIALGSAGVPQWSFSNGQTATGSPVRRIFSTPGNYTAKLKHTSDKGCMDSLTLPYTVGEKVILKYTVSNVCLEEPSLFTDSSYSVQPVNVWNWDFGNGVKSTQPNPSYTYKMPGVYNTRLQISTLPGCNYATGKTTTVHPKPLAYFTHDPDQGTIVNPNITFTDKSQGADTVRYVFSTGFKTNARNFTHSLPDSGIFNITQFVYTQFGCRDSFTKQVVINYMYTQHVPTAFTPDGNNLNEGFGPSGMGIRWYAMKIYSRWGEKLYDTRESKPWNGTYNGEPVPEGVYVVLMELKDHKGRNHYYKGTVQILRKPE